MTYRGRVYQDGHEVAMVASGNREDVERDTAHYAHQYFQDGDVDIVIKNGRKIAHKEYWRSIDGNNIVIQSTP